MALICLVVRVGLLLLGQRLKGPPPFFTFYVNPFTAVFPITTRYAAFRNTAFSSTVALYLIGVPNMQYDDVRLDSVKTVFRVFSPEYRVPRAKGN